MARPPRGGGFRSTDVRGTLGSLIKSTLAQAGVVRDVLERGAREGRSRLDEARAGKRRHDALAELGEAVLELIRRGEIDLAEIPEVRDVVADLEQLDAAAPGRGGRGGGGWARGGGGGGHDEVEDGGGVPWEDDEPLSDVDRERHAGGLGDIARPTSRQRFDDRRGSGGGSDGTVSSARWVGAGDGAGAGARARTAEAPRVWRPPAPTGAEAPVASKHPTVPALPRAIAAKAHKGGGITFDDDDLADYMHPDDVPAKPPHDES